jgi:hypothetical protein
MLSRTCMQQGAPQPQRRKYVRTLRTPVNDSRNSRGAPRQGAASPPLPPSEVAHLELLMQVRVVIRRRTRRPRVGGVDLRQDGIDLGAQLGELRLERGDVGLELVHLDRGGGLLLLLEPRLGGLQSLRDGVALLRKRKRNTKNQERVSMAEQQRGRQGFIAGPAPSISSSQSKKDTISFQSSRSKELN